MELRFRSHGGSPPRRGTQAGLGASAGPPRTASDHAARLPVSRHTARPTRHSVSALSALHRRVPVEPATCVRARRFSRVPLLDPAGPSPPGGGVRWQGRARARDEVDLRAGWLTPSTASLAERGPVLFGRYHLHCCARRGKCAMPSRTPAQCAQALAPAVRSAAARTPRCGVVGGVGSTVGSGVPSPRQDDGLVHAPAVRASAGLASEGRMAPHGLVVERGGGVGRIIYLA